MLRNIGIGFGCNCAGRLIASLRQFVAATFNGTDKVATVVATVATAVAIATATVIVIMPRPTTEIGVLVEVY